MLAANMPSLEGLRHAACDQDPEVILRPVLGCRGGLAAVGGMAGRKINPPIVIRDLSYRRGCRKMITYLRNLGSSAHETPDTLGVQWENLRAIESDPLDASRRPCANGCLKAATRTVFLPTWRLLHVRTSIPAYPWHARADRLSAGSRAETALTYADLVRRMTDLERLAVLPLPGENAAQWSSYDRASKYDEKTGKYIHWDANGDGNGIIRKEGKQS